MKFRSIEKKGSGDYLSRYDIHYETPPAGRRSTRCSPATRA